MNAVLGLFITCLFVMFVSPAYVEDVDLAAIYVFLAAFGAIISFFTLLWMGVTEHNHKYKNEEDEEPEVEL